MHLTRRLPFLFAFLLLLAACGGGTTPSTAADDGAETAATPTPTATEAGTDSGGGAVPASDAGGEAGVTEWCHNTVEEVSAAFGVDVADAVGTAAPGLGGGCAYTYADPTMGYAISTITTGDVRATIDAFRGGEGASDVVGIGDTAVLISPQGPLAVVKGNILISLAAYGLPIVEDAAAYRAALEELGRSAADRLP